jgi:hypothetical protein
MNNSINNWVKNLQENPQKLIKCNTKLVKDWRKDLDNILHGIIRGILFSGDRFSCCNEAAVLYDFDGNFIGIATISFRGEDYSGKPEVVGLYVRQTLRSHSETTLKQEVNTKVQIFRAMGSFG